MNLANVFKHQAYHSHMNLSQVEVDHITDDSRQVIPGSLFFARQGSTLDGTRYIQSALEAGAVAYVVEGDFNQSTSDMNSVEIVVENLQWSLQSALEEFYQFPLESLQKFAVTGTNGKTTITYILDQILTSQAPNVLLGTIENKIGDQVIESQLTTPGMVDFYKLLSQGVQAGCQSATMELSSHAIEQKRVGELKLDAAIFTNLSQDHLDYHGDMGSYFKAKSIMFTECLSASCVAIINVKDSWGEELVKIIDNPVWTYSTTSKESDIFILEDHSSTTGIRMEVSTPACQISVECNLIGEFNKENILGAIGALLSVGIDQQVIEQGLKELNVPGRLELVKSDEGQVFIDYAHTPDALKRVLETLYKIKKGRILTVFGCGGDRDKTKRPLMASVSEKYSDIVFVTSDNPRTESAHQIIEDVLQGFESTQNVYVELDRRSAIAQAIGTMSGEDIVLIAGKGHEDYQIIGTEKTHFDDKQVVLELLGDQ